jgi:hypothetical protein
MEKKMKRNLKIEKLNHRNMMTADICFPAPQPEECGEPTWHNYAEPTDVNDSGETTVLDALVVLNEMAIGEYTDEENSYTLVDPSSVDHPEIYYDVNNDGRGTALDALLVLNYLARQQNSYGESEQFPVVEYNTDLIMKEEKTWLFQPL